MGSGQSSSGETISVDRDGKITRKQANGQQSSETVYNQKQYNAGKENINDKSRDEQPASKVEELKQPAQAQEADLVSNMTSASTKPKSDDLSLGDADEIASRLKNKYKPNSEEMAGKQQSVFEEVERNLIQCYTANKDQSANCSQVYKEYKDYVEKQRNQLLKNSGKIPLITTILVIITCLLLHITTISCFGAMSIDLGSEWMKVGLVAPSVQMDIVLNAQSQRKTPMAIAFSNGERFVGDTALDVASKYPEKSFTHFLDLVGKSIEHESVQHYKRRFPHANIQSHQPNSTSIVLNHPDGLQFTPLELISMMIQHAHDQVTNRLNSNEPTYDVVLTVPPFFGPSERRVVEDAARIIGLNVLRLTNVNSAFALTYGIFRHKDYLPESNGDSAIGRTSILFFDQGASQTSATLADYHLVEQFDETTGSSKNESLPTVTIRAQVYDRYLGGFDMQLKLRDYLVKAFAKTHKIDEKRILQRGRSAAKLLKESGRVKKVLSANTDHLVRVENVIDDKDLSHPISRKEFEDLNEEYLGKRVIALLDKLFEMPGVSRSDPLESVIIVGGNTRTPKIQQVLLDYFKLETLGKSINADEGAALAALYQAASLGRGFRVKKFVLEEFGEERKRFDPEKAAAIAAAAATSTVAPGADSSSESSETTTTVTPATTSDISPTATRDPNVIYSESELERISRKLADYREQDYQRLQRLSMRNSLESLLSEGREKLSDDDEKLRDKKEEIQKLISETNDWLEDSPREQRDNVTILADKFNALHALIHPAPPTLPPFDPTSVDLSQIPNETLKILDALNLKNPFATTLNETEHNDSSLNATAAEPGADKKGDPPHLEL